MAGQSREPKAIEYIVLLIVIVVVVVIFRSKIVRAVNVPAEETEYLPPKELRPVQPSGH